MHNNDAAGDSSLFQIHVVFSKYSTCCVCEIKMIITKQHQIEGRWPLLSFPLLPVFRSAMIECTQTLSGAPWPAEGGTRQVGSKLSAVNYWYKLDRFHMVLLSFASVCNMLDSSTQGHNDILDEFTSSNSSTKTASFLLSTAYRGKSLSSNGWPGALGCQPQCSTTKYQCWPWDLQKPYRNPLSGSTSGGTVAPPRVCITNVSTICFHEGLPRRHRQSFSIIFKHQSTTPWIQDCSLSRLCAVSIGAPQSKWAALRVRSLGATSQGAEKPIGGLGLRWSQMVSDGLRWSQHISAADTSLLGTMPQIDQINRNQQRLQDTELVVLKLVSRSSFFCQNGQGWGPYPIEG